MRSRITSVLASSLATLVSLGVLDWLGCELRDGCLQDDASIRASAIFAAPLALLFLVTSWLVVFPSAFALRRRLSVIGASVLSSLVFALVTGVALHRPAIDGSLLHTLSVVVPLLGASWLVGSWVALTLWPTATGQAPAQ